jgi:hypothetical protein
MVVQQDTGFPSVLSALYSQQPIVAYALKPFPEIIHWPISLALASSQRLQL